MTTTRRQILAMGAMLAATGGALAQEYPTRPITFIVPFGAGGGTDVITRALLDELQKALGQSIIVDPRPGGNGIIGSTAVARAAPDGYTMLSTASSTYSLNPNLVKEMPYDQLAALVPVAMLGRSPWLLTVPVNSEFKSLDDVIKYGKANPGKLAFPFWQSSVLVTGEAFGRAAGIQLRKVPYKGAVEATTDFLAGRLPIYITDTNAARPQVQAGTMRVLATTGPKRSGMFPDVPSMRELGLDVVTDSMLAIFAPAGTPKPILERMNKEVSKIVDTSKGTREKLEQLGVDPSSMSLAEADSFVRTELTRWADMIEKAGIQKN